MLSTLPQPPRPPRPPQPSQPSQPSQSLRPLPTWAARPAQPLAPSAPALTPATCARFMTEVFASPVMCPHCGSRCFHRWGKTRAARAQRFRCHDCKRTFTSLTGTPLARLHHRERWPLFLACMQRSLPLRPTARVVGVDKDTAFRWRHRFCRFLLGVRTECLGPAVELTSFRSLFHAKGQGNGYPASFPRKAAACVAVHPGSRPGRQQSRKTHVPPLRAELPHPFRPRLEQHLATILTAADQGGRFVAYALRPDFFAAASGQTPDPVGPLPRLQLVSGAVVEHEGGLLTYAFRRLCGQRSPGAVYVRVSRRKLISRHAAAAAPVGRFRAVWQEVWELRWWLRRFRGVSIRWLQSYLTWFMALRRAGVVITPADEVSYYAAAG